MSEERKEKREKKLYALRAWIEISGRGDASPTVKIKLRSEILHLKPPLLKGGGQVIIRSATPKIKKTIYKPSCKM